MTVPLTAARPLDAGDLLDETFRMFRRNFGLFFGIAGLPFIAWVPVDLAGRAFIGPDERWLFDTVGSGLLPGTLAWGGCTWAAWRLSLGRPATLGAAFSAVWRRVPEVLLVSLLAGLLAMVLWLTIVGIRWTVGWSLATAALFAEELGPGAALARGRELVRGTWWRACGIVVLLFLTSIVLFAMTETPEMFVRGEFFPAPVELVEGFDPILLALDIATDSAGVILGTPIGAIGTFLLYRDLRIRKEGWDLLARAEQLDARAL